MAILPAASGFRDRAAATPAVIVLRSVGGWKRGGCDELPLAGGSARHASAALTASSGVIAATSVRSGAISIERRPADGADPLAGVLEEPQRATPA